MELIKEILAKVIEQEEINITFPNLTINLSECVNSECYKALQKIMTIIENDSFSDFECIERIVCVFEEIGSGSNRHDFG